ncbi:membrane protein [Bradyrhizobium japonicum]|uniref:Membrane protein n=1 Tax=Bradyrhizobium japonicum TaxID=375 RepID=A0A0A3Y1U2_BRAJP|nr:SemiSWEET family transporter [Bradyrhizobium japonicum]KGT79504.1 membrane protein [Bradyrhizobium japonicum]
MLDPIAPYVGGIAALLASLSYVPQVRKAWPRGSTDDLSLLMLWALTLGLGFWIVYGVIRADWMIVGANVIGAALAAVVLGCKIRDLGSRGR